jgi:tryptophan-rich sensory protein
MPYRQRCSWPLLQSVRAVQSVPVGADVPRFVPPRAASRVESALVLPRASRRFSKSEPCFIRLLHLLHLLHLWFVFLLKLETLLAGLLVVAVLVVAVLVVAVLVVAVIVHDSETSWVWMVPTTLLLLLM